MDIISKLKEPLKIEDIDFRIQSISAKGYACIISYKDARVDMNRLDAVCGVSWQDDYKILNDELYCGIGIKINDEWIWRWDVGVESNTEKVKGRASDAFKRAAYRWGIGRELYNHPRIYVQLFPDEFTPDGNKAKATWNLQLDKWKWEVEYEGENLTVKKLTAYDQNGKLRYSFPEAAKHSAKQDATQKSSSSQRPANSTQGEKPWLNVMDKDKNFTNQWLNVLKAIKDGKVQSIADIEKHYRLSKEVKQKLITEHKLS